MAVAGDTTYLAGGLIGIIEADAIAQLGKSGVTRKLCKVKSSPAAETISWIMYNDGSNVINATDVVATAEGTVTPTSKLNSNKKTATLDMYSVMTHIYDSAELSNVENVTGEVGPILGNAVALAIDTLLNANFANFANSAGTSTVAIAVSDLFNALASLETYMNDGIFNAVLHRKQIWGDYGLFADLATNNNLAAAPSIQQTALATGWVDKVAGIGLYNSNELTETSSAIKGGVFGKNAFGWGFAGQEITVEAEREASYKRTAYISSFFGGTAEIQDTNGAYIHTLTTAL